MTTTTPPQTTIPTAPTGADMQTMVQQGSQCIENGDLRGALEAFEGVVQAFPTRPEGHNNLGALYTSLGEFAKAENCFNQVVALLPDHPGIYYNRGMARSSLEKFDAAREDFQKVLQHDPTDTDCLNNLGVMDFMQGRFQDAREHFTQALDIRPDYARALLNLCDVEIATGNGSEAVQRCEDFLKTYQNIEVKRALLEVLSTGCREALDKAGQTARNLLTAGADDPEISQKLERIQKAKAVLEEKPGI